MSSPVDSFSAPGVESSAVHGTQHDKSSTPQGTDGIEAETTQGTGTEPGQPKRRKLTSEVWNEFHKEFIGGRWQAQCMYCKKWLSAASTGGTTHLNNHLKLLNKCLKNVDHVYKNVNMYLKKS